MKKTIFLILFALTFKMASAQTNEIKVDIFDVLALLAVEVTYEYSLNSESSLGISGLYNFSETSSKFRYKENYAITPYFRQNLFGPGSINYYLEFFGSLNSGDVESDNLEELENTEYTDFALGLSFGGKYISNNGFIADIHLGIGRNLFNTDLSPGIIPRVGISIGKQF